MSTADRKAMLVQTALILTTFIFIEARPQSNGLDALRQTIPGEPGRDYPIYSIDVIHNLNRQQQQEQIRKQQQRAQQQQQQRQQEPRDGRNGAGNQDFQAQIDSGVVPGVPGRDYPTNSVTGLRRKFPGLQPAPAELVTPDFPGNQGGNGNRNNGNRNRINGGPQRRKNNNNRNNTQRQQNRNNSLRQQQQQNQQRRQQQQDQQRQQQIRQQQQRRQQQQQQEERRRQQEQRRQQQQAQQPVQQQQPLQQQIVPDQPRSRPTLSPAQQQRLSNVPTIPRTDSEPVQIFNGRYCPGNNVQTCKDFCPREPSNLAQECQQECDQSC